MKKGEINPNSLRQKCLTEGISYKAATSRHYDHPELTEDEIIQYYIDKKEKKRAKEELCQAFEKLGATARQANKYHHNYPNLSAKEIITIYQKDRKKDMELNIVSESLTQQGLSVNRTVLKRLMEHDLSQKEIQDRCFAKQKREVLRKECQKHEIRYESARYLFDRFPDAPVEVIIKYYLDKQSGRHPVPLQKLYPPAFPTNGPRIDDTAGR